MNAATLITAYYDAFNRGDREAMLSMLTDDVAHDLNQGAREVGREAFRACGAWIAAMASNCAASW